MNKLFNEPMKQYTLRLPQSVLDEMQKIVNNDKMKYPTISYLIRIILSEGLNKIKKEK